MSRVAAALFVAFFWGWVVGVGGAEDWLPDALWLSLVFVLGYWVGRLISSLLGTLEIEVTSAWPPRRPARLLAWGGRPGVDVQVGSHADRWNVGLAEAFARGGRTGQMLFIQEEMNRLRRERADQMVRLVNAAAGGPSGV